MAEFLIAVVDYKMGNLASVVNALRLLGVSALVSSNPHELEQADAYILPGVGAFPQAVKNLNKCGLTEFLNTQVIQLHKPILGICLGMQLMAKDSLEQNLTAGLGWIDGHVIALDSCRLENIHVPHVGWNNISFEQDDCFFENIDNNSHFYFDHTYKFECADKEAILAICDYGQEVVSVLRKENIFATQFHPEKSQRSGLKILRNFLNFIDGYSKDIKKR